VIFKGLPREMGQWHAGDTVKIHYRFKASKSAISPEETDFYLDGEFFPLSVRLLPLPAPVQSSSSYRAVHVGNAIK
jgi:hypothetical protein